MKRIRIFTATLITLGCLHGSTVHARSAFVEVLQMPAWLEQGGERTALRPGDEIRSGDRVITGDRARIRVRMADNSHVKLGQSGEIHFEQVQEADEVNPFTGIIDVVQGAFRYTTLKTNKLFRRDIRFNIRAISAGIRGTDIWGRSTEASNLLALIEGEVSASVDGGQPFTMDRPLSYFELTPSDRTASITTVDLPTLQQWAAETETASGEGVVGIDGRWHVNTGSFSDAGNVRKLQNRLEKAGYATITESASVKGIDYTRVQVRGFLSDDDARAFASGMEGRFGISAAWVIASE